jgi:transposase InsO family protein
VRVRRRSNHSASGSTCFSRAGTKARAEGFIKTLKCEEVYLRQYRDAEEGRASIDHFIEEVYNRKRLHSALGYQSPEAFEAAGRGQTIGGVSLAVPSVQC